jgi:hypothetical protein
MDLGAKGRDPDMGSLTVPEHDAYVNSSGGCPDTASRPRGFPRPAW